ncbi:MAG TPA: AlkA N-terminal domain-containing protein, partial [Polyangia bacterium]|nr:AlkA N-terminal domain-containing protein [Polyangia bacterium]
PARPAGGGHSRDVSPLDPNACYRALVAHDARFDGLFFVGVTTTGIYCRPVCRARTPGRDRCVFFRTAAQAEAAGFRSCFRCRPELAPGAASVDAVSRVVATAMRRIDEGALSHEGTVDELARELDISTRHLRRAMQAELGVSPLALAESRRLALARQLIVDTALPMTEVAFASGFRSVRRFNAAVKARYARSPSEKRRTMRGSGDAGETVTVTLSYRAPYDWPSMLSHLASRAIPGVELVRDETYTRTAAVGALRGWLTVSADPTRAALRATISTSLAGALATVATRLRRLFDLDAEPAVIATHLARDPRLAAHVRARPGLRVAGAFDVFEAAARAVLGQQVSVAAAGTLAGRMAAQLGEPIETPHAALDRVFPVAGVVALRSGAALAAALRIPARRAETLRVIAEAVSNGALALDAADDPARLIDQIVALPGMGPWTAHALAMRALGWPDAFPEGDLVLRKALGGISGRQARALAERWRPWRAYGATHLWAHYGAARASTQAAGVRQP